MRVYTVHEPPDPPQDRVDRAELMAFVSDGWSLGAMVWPPLWLAGHGLWVELLGYLAAAGTLLAAPTVLGLPALVGFVPLFGLHVLIGLEAGSLRRWSLRRRGWRSAGTVVGRSRTECERRFFEDWLPSQPILGGGQGAAPGGLAHVPSPRPPEATLDSSSTGPGDQPRRRFLGWRRRHGEA